MELIEFEGRDGKMAIVAKHIQGVIPAKDDKAKTHIIIARLSDEVDDYFVVYEPYEKVKEKLGKIVL